VDEPMLEAAGFGVALANSPDSLKRKADHVTVESHYLGFLEAIDFLENSGFL
jgi:hydroxymethylpyrimidine pyrophosphatase-like HAD family hydrolase